LLNCFILISFSSYLYPLLISYRVLSVEFLALFNFFLILSFSSAVVLHLSLAFFLGSTGTDQSGADQTLGAGAGGVIGAGS